MIDSDRNLYAQTITIIRESGVGRILFFGLFGITLAGVIHIISARQSGAEWAQITQVHHTRTLVLALPYDEAFELCVQSVAQIEKSQVTKTDRVSGNIEVAVGITWHTLGDTIEFNLRKVNANTTAVEFSSGPSVRTTLIDYGKNLRNIQVIERVVSPYAQE